MKFSGHWWRGRGYAFTNYTFGDRFGWSVCVGVQPTTAFSSCPSYDFDFWVMAVTGGPVLHAKLCTYMVVLCGGPFVKYWSLGRCAGQI